MIVGWELQDLKIDSGATDGHKVSAVVGAVGSEQVRTLKRYKSTRRIIYFALLTQRPANTSLVPMVEIQLFVDWVVFHSWLTKQ